MEAVSHFVRRTLAGRGSRCSQFHSAIPFSLNELATSRFFATSSERSQVGVPASPPETDDSPSAVSAAEGRGSTRQRWMYYFQELPPDVTAGRLSQASKENIWQLHRQDPNHWTVERLSKEYRVRQERIHAILHLKDEEKRLEEEKGPLDTEIQDSFDKTFGTVDKAVGERHVTMYPSEKVEQLEGEARSELLLEESAVEAARKLKEFETRFEFNKKQRPGGPILTNRMLRRRPSAGWSFLVEELGEGSRGAEKGRWRYVVGSDGRKRGLNDLEKLFLEREKVQARRRVMPR